MRTAIAVLEMPRGGIVRVHHQPHFRSRQLAERRADRPLARRRDQRERILGRRRIGLIGVEAGRRFAIERGGEEIDLAGRACVASRRRTARAAAERRHWRRRDRASLADRRRHLREHVEHLFELARRVGVLRKSSRRNSSPKTSAFERASPTASITGRASCRLIGPYARANVVALEERRGRQQDVA